jgi:choline kinase
VIGVVLAAGWGRRLMPHTEHVPKTLLPVDGDRTIMDVILRNLADVGLTDVVVVVGHAAHMIEQRQPDLERDHGVRLELVRNQRIDWNNAYSLWLARDHFAGGALLVNGDTLHPVHVERTLLAQRGPGVRLAVDTVKDLTAEAMKVRVDDTGRVVAITKAMPTERADGEYIGAALLGADAVRDLTECLTRTWQVDPDRYYEDAFQLLADQTGGVHATAIGTVAWVEVDDLDDLARAREVACNC